jgi:RNA polymerase sigma-70 factor (ECF subfamily)
MADDEMDQSSTTTGLSLAPAAATTSASDRAATFAALYASHKSAVYRYLRSRTTSDDEAADRTATTFEHAFVALDRLRPDGSALAWLLRIARNAAIDDARRRRPADALDDLSEADQPIARETPEEAYLAAERAAELRELVRGLPEVQRDAIALRYASGLSASEIGQVIGKSEAASQKLIQRALATLREARHVDR